MINVAEEIKQAYENSTTQIDKITINNKDYRITNVEYYDDCYLDGNIFGTAIGRMLEFEIENTIELEKAEVKYSTGLLINGIKHWISLGNFIVKSIEPNDTTGINKVIAMDYMLKTNIEYESNLNYSSNKITLLQVLQEVCTNSGLELATTSFANSNFIVDSNQFEQGTLNRQVIQAVAQISGTFAKIKSDNKLYLITPKRKGLLVKDVHTMTVAELNALPVEKLSACDNKFNLNSYKELVVKRNTHPINLVSLGMSDIEGENIVLRDEESIASDGENSLVINDNPFAYTQAKREQLITALFDCVKGFEYTSYEISGQSKPYLETGDEVVAIDREGNLYNSFLFRFNFKSPKGLESQMSAPSIIKATVEYQNVPNALNIAKRTERKVDKQNQKIEDLVSQQTTTESKLTQVEQTVDGISERVEHMADVTNTARGVKTLTLENCVAGPLLELHIYGNNSVFKHMYVSDDLYPSDDLIIYGDSRIKTYTQNICPTQIKDWEQGSFNGTTGEKLNSSNSLRVVNMLEVENKEITLSVEGNDYCLNYIYIYDSDKNYLGGYSSTAGEKTATIKLASATKYINVTVRRKDERTINLSEIVNVKPQIEYGNQKTEFIENNTQLMELGITEVLRQNEEVYDEYILKDGQAKVIRRVAEDGTTLAEEALDDLGEYNIPLVEGTNIIEIKNYTASMEVKYALKNAYTDIYATKVEMNASIEIAEQKINLEVSKKVDNEDFTGANIKLQINGDTSEARIEADQININGTVSANGNFKVGTDGKMECTDATINGGNVTINDSSTSYGKSKFKINGPDTKGYMSSTSLEMYHDDFSSGVALAIDGIQGGNQISAYSTDGSVGIGFGEIWADGNIYGDRKSVV